MEEGQLDSPELKDNMQYLLRLSKTGSAESYVFDEAGNLISPVISHTELLRKSKKLLCNRVLSNNRCGRWKQNVKR